MSQHKGNAKLTPKDVLEIRKLRGEGWTIAALARGFKMSGNQIAKICDGTAWAHISQGTEVITDTEGQLRQLTTSGPTPQEIQASQEKFLRLLKAQEAQAPEYDLSSIPEQYRGVDTGDPEAYQREIQRMIKEAQQRTLHNGPPPEPVRVRQPQPPHSNAEKLLETLKDAVNPSTTTRDTDSR